MVMLRLVTINCDMNSGVRKLILSHRRVCMGLDHLFPAFTTIEHFYTTELLIFLSYIIYLYYFLPFSAA
jgi:hypothetical protein